MASGLGLESVSLSFLWKLCMRIIAIFRFQSYLLPASMHCKLMHTTHWQGKAHHMTGREDCLRGLFLRRRRNFDFEFGKWKIWCQYRLSRPFDRDCRRISYIWRLRSWLIFRCRLCCGSLWSSFLWDRLVCVYVWFYFPLCIFICLKCWWLDFFGVEVRWGEQ